MSRYRYRFNTSDPSLLTKAEKLTRFLDSIMPDVERVAQHAWLERVGYARCWVCRRPLTPHGPDECPHSDAEIGKAMRIVLGTEPN